MQAETATKRRILDDFSDVSAWLPVTSGLAQLAITRDAAEHGASMRLDFDFKGGGGFVVARKTLSLPLPPAYSLTFDVRGACPANKFELKLVDPSGRNVWWYHDDAFAFSEAWRRVCIRSRRIEFAWGPAGGGPMEEVGAIELAIVAGPGGAGSVWISDLRFSDDSVHPPPLARASSTAGEHRAQLAFDLLSETGWRSEPDDPQPWLALSFHEERELGGLVVRWDPAAPARSFQVETSADGRTWAAAHSTSARHGTRSYVYLPDTVTPFLRLVCRPENAGRGVGIAEIEIQSYEFSRSVDAFFREVARRERRGLYPRYVYGEQSYWTPVGTGDGLGCAILNEEGMLEIDVGGFSLEPFLHADGSLVTWADAEVTQTLESGYLPIPSSVWRAGTLGLVVTAFAGEAHGRQVVYVRYRVRNDGDDPRSVHLFVAIRPFQVTPPWQRFEHLGGLKTIREIAYRGAQSVRVDRKTVIALTPPNRFGAAACADGVVTHYLDRGELPPAVQVDDVFEYASGALEYEIRLGPRAHEDVYVAVPFGTVHAESAPSVSAATAGCAELEEACRKWERRLTRVSIRVPQRAQACVDALRTATGHVLLHRDGPALQPGPRRYTRAWIRDGAIMAAALLRMGCTDEACEFVRWYAGFQAPDGDVPCAVDRKGADWLVEHDSHGELIFAITECFRFTGDRAFLSELWPNVLRGAATIERLRATRLTTEYDAADKRARRGLLPESVSHEGYLAHPVHSYYDDFWAVRGLYDAAAVAEALGDHAQSSRLALLRDSLLESLYRSIALTIEERHLDYVPGSVEWADFDPAATTTALMLLDVEKGIGPHVLRRTYDEYVEGFRKRRDGMLDWDKYSAYEIRIIGALVRLGRRAEAHELLDFFLDDRRPRVWNQWPEISWRDSRSPGHLGDVPHTWIAAEYVLAVLGMFAYERVEDDALVLCAGIKDEWLHGGADVSVANLATYYGPVSYTLRREAPGVLRLSFAGAPRTAPRSIVIRPPLADELRSVSVDDRAFERFDASTITLSHWPAEVVMRTTG